MSDFDFDFRFPSTPRTFDRMPRPYGYELRAPPGSFARDEWHNLNEELTQNVECELPPYAEDEGSVFEEDVFQSTTSLLPKQEPSDRKIKTEEEKMDFPSEIATPVPPENDYMGRESPFALDFPPHSEMSFIEYYPQGDATITFPNEAGEMDSISGLHPWIMEERCPLLAQSFEDTRSGPRLHLEVLSPRTARPFLRYLYTGSYAFPGRSGDVYEDIPTSVLLHCELYRLGDIYDLVDLKQQANVNVTRQCEFGCSSPNKPIDLCAAIEYVYQHLRDHTGLLETIICYCVTCFLRHNLDDDAVFQALAYRLREFNQDLCRESMKRDFEDEGKSHPSLTKKKLTNAVKPQLQSSACHSNLTSPRRTPHEKTSAPIDSVMLSITSTATTTTTSHRRRERSLRCRKDQGSVVSPLLCDFTKERRGARQKRAKTFL